MAQDLQPANQHLSTPLETKYSYTTHMRITYFPHSSQSGYHACILRVPETNILSRNPRQRSHHPSYYQTARTVTHSLRHIMTHSPAHMALTSLKTYESTVCAPVNASAKHDSAPRYFPIYSVDAWRGSRTTCFDHATEKLRCGQNPLERL